MSIGLGAYGSFWIIACVARWLARLLVWPSCNGGPAAWVILPTSFLAGASAVSCFSCVARWLARLLVWPSCNGGPAAWVILPTSFLAGASAVSCFCRTQ